MLVIDELGMVVWIGYGIFCSDDIVCVVWLIFVDLVEESGMVYLIFDDFFVKKGNVELFDML